MENIKISEIRVLENLRTSIERDQDLEELMQDIKTRGLMQPIGLSKQGEEYVVVFGHRRFYAVKKLGWSDLSENDYKLLPPNLSFEEYLIYNAVENIHRKDISPIELGKVISRLKETGLSLGEIAVKLSITKMKAKKFSDLYNRIPSEFEGLVGYVTSSSNKKGKIAVATTEAILNLRLNNKKDYEKIFNLAKKEELSATNIKLIGLLMRQGMNMDEAYKYLTVAHVGIFPVVLRKEAERRLQVKYGLSTGEILRRVVKGDIQPQRDLLI